MTSALRSMYSMMCCRSLTHKADIVYPHLRATGLYQVFPYDTQLVCKLCAQQNKLIYSFNMLNSQALLDASGCFSLITKVKFMGVWSLNVAYCYDMRRN